MKFRRYIDNGLNHFDTDDPHNDAALTLHECEPCLTRVRQIAVELQEEI